MTDENTQRQPPAPNPALKRLDKLVGEWHTEGSHRLLPNTIVRGQVAFEWLEGGAFLIQRSTVEHVDFPNSIAIIGQDDATEGCIMHYFDSRGVSRIYGMSLSDGVWKIWRDSPGFSQRFTGTFDDDGNTITGRWEISRDGEYWEHDLELTYTRAS